MYAFSDEIISATLYKLAQFPITDLVYEDKDDDLKSRWKKVLEEDLAIRTKLEEAGLDYNCLHGDVRAVTKNGVFRLRDLSGKTVEVLSQDGVYRPATFKCYGRQEFMEVELSDGRTILATKDHIWPIITSSGNVVKRPTEDIAGLTLLRSVAARPEQNDEFYEGVRHGFVFGDGTLYNDGKQARAIFCGAKDKGMLKYFEGVGSKPYEARLGVIYQHGLPPHYKNLPENERSASYWYGFVCGFLAADGSVDVAGYAVLTQKSEATLRAIEVQLPRIGMIAGVVREHPSGRSSYVSGSSQCFLSLYRQYLRPEDFLLDHHRERFEEHFKETNYGQKVRVVDVRETGIVDEAFCCVEEQTHTFVIENGVLTGNCYGNYIGSFYVPFIRMLVCPHCRKQKPIKSSKFQFNPKDFKFYMKCATCAPDEPLPMVVVDKPMTKTTAGMNIIRWDPAQIDIEHNPISGNSTYYYNLPNQLKRQIWAGRRRVLEETPMSFIMAAKEGARVELEPTNIIHIKRPSMSYFDNGWGIPLIVPLLKSRYIYQIFLKSREVIAQQHIVPMWMLYPLPQANLDPASHLNLAKWRQEIENAVRRWRRDPNHIAVFPIPTGFQQIGGDARALTMMDEIRFLQETMIIGLQVPREFLMGGMSWSGSSVTFRMVENFFLNHIRGLKQLLRFVIDKVSKATKLKPVDVSMTRLKWVDDVQQKSLLMQANMNGKVSDETFVSELGHSMAKEFEQIQGEVDKRAKITVAQMKAQAEAEGEAMMIQAKYQAKAQVEMAKMQRDIMTEYTAMGFTPAEAQALMNSLAQQKPGGGQSTPGGVLKNEPNKPGTDGKQMSNPDAWAGQFMATLSQMQPADRDSALMRLQLENPQLHSIVMSKWMEQQGVDSRPNPQQKPPNRNAGKAPTPSSVR